MSGYVSTQNIVNGVLRFRVREQTNQVAQNPPQMTVEEALEHAKRAFALRKYEQAVDYYATALEMKCVASLIHYNALVAELLSEQNNAARIRQRMQTCTLHMGRPCSRTLSLRVLSLVKTRERSQKKQLTMQVCAFLAFDLLQTDASQPQDPAPVNWATSSLSVETATMAKLPEKKIRR